MTILSIISNEKKMTIKMLNILEIMKAMNAKRSGLNVLIELNGKNMAESL